MGRQGLLIDYEYCTGCHSCEVACQAEHGFPHDRWGIKLAEIGPWQIKEDKWQYAYIPVPTEQCDLCGKRRAQGKLPTCVSHCQASVMKYGPVENLVADLEAKPRQVLFAPM